MAILSRTAGWIPAISERSQNFGYNALARFSQIIQKKHAFSNTNRTFPKLPGF